MTPEGTVISKKAAQIDGASLSPEDTLWAVSLPAPGPAYMITGQRNLEVKINQAGQRALSSRLKREIDEPAKEPGIDSRNGVEQQ